MRRVDGELFVTPGPGEFHQDFAGELHALLREYLKGHGVGKVMNSPADVRRGDRKRNRVQSDVFVVQLTDGKRPEYPYELHDLLLAVEVVSPSNPLLDYQVDWHLKGMLTPFVLHLDGFFANARS